MRRVFVLSVLSALAFAAVVVGAVFPTPAYAAVPSITTMGGPINVLPSAVKAASASSGALSQADMMAVYMYRASKSPEFWALYQRAQQTAVSTGKPLALTAEVAAEAKTVYPSASKVAPFIKGAGTVGAVVTAYQMAGTLTNGVMDLVGLDATGNVCSNAGTDLWGKVLATTAGANCADYNKMRDDFTKNQDASGELTNTRACSATSGGCVQWTGFSSFTRPDKSVGNIYACGTTTGDFGSYTGSDLVYMVTLAPDGTLRNSQFIPNQQLNSGPNAPTDACKAAGGLGMLWLDSYSGKFAPDGAAGFADQMTVKCLYSASSTRGCAPGDVVPTIGSADPQRTLKCVTLGSDGKEYVRTSDPFFESAGVLPDPKCSDLPAGVKADGAKIVETGGDNGDQTIWEAKTDPKVADALKNYGECGTTSVCPLVLFQDGKSCFDAADCTDWSKDPDQSRYTCKYGPYAAPMSECQTYKNRWQPEAQQSGNTLTDPETGEPLKNPKPELSPGSDTAAATRPVADPENAQRNCLPSGTAALNPVNWVMMPVQCALEWAFVPRPSVMENTFKDMQATTDKSGIGSFKTIVAGYAGVWFPDTVCEGPPLTINVAAWDLHVTSYPFNACSEPMKGAAATTKTIIGAVLSLIATLAVVRYVTSIFGGIAFGSSTTESVNADPRTGEVK